MTARLLAVGLLLAAGFVLSACGNGPRPPGAPPPGQLVPSPGHLKHL